MKVMGAARVVDFNADKTACRVRLCSAGGMPMGKVLTGVRFIPDDAQLNAFVSSLQIPDSSISDHDLDTAAKQNLYYNSFFPVVIE